MAELEATGIDRRYKAPTIWRILALTSGMVVWNMLYTAQGQFQLYGLSVLGIDATLVTLYVVIFTIIDIINDPIIGRLSDKSKRFTRRFGKRFIWLIISNVGMVVFLLLMFLPWPILPGGGLPTETLIILAVIWLAFTSAMFDNFQTFNEMNTEALNVDLMRDPESRRRLTLVRVFTETLLGLILGILLVPLLLSLFNAFDDTGLADNPNAFFLMAVVISIIALISIPIRAWGIWEPKEMREFRADLDQKIERPPFMLVLKRILKDRNWWAIMIQSLWWGFTARAFTVGVSFYILITLGLDIGLSIIPQAVMILSLVIFGVISYFLMKRIGTKKTVLIGIIVTCIGFFLMVFSTSIWTFTLFVIIGAGGVGLQNSATSVANKEALDAAVLKHGTREEAQYFAINGVVRSASTAIQTIVLLLIILGFGIDMTLGTGNTESAKFGLLFNISIVIAIFTAITGIAYWKLFNITPEMAEANKDKLLELGR